MQYLYDENGRRYLDAFAGIVTVSCGHCHPQVLNAIMEQNKLLQHATTIYLHHAIADFAEALASKMPGNLKVHYLQVYIFHNCYTMMLVTGRNLLTTKSNHYKIGLQIATYTAIKTTSNTTYYEHKIFSVLLTNSYKDSYCSYIWYFLQSSQIAANKQQ